MTQNIRIGDRVRFTFEHEVFAKFQGLEGTVIDYDTRGSDDEEKHTVVVKWDTRDNPTVTEPKVLGKL